LKTLGLRAKRGTGPECPNFFGISRHIGHMYKTRFCLVLDTIVF